MIPALKFSKGLQANKPTDISPVSSQNFHNLPIFVVFCPTLVFLVFLLYLVNVSQKNGNILKYFGMGSILKVPRL